MVRADQLLSFAEMYRKTTAKRLHQAKDGDETGRWGLCWHLVQVHAAHASLWRTWGAADPEHCMLYWSHLH